MQAAMRPSLLTLTPLDVLLVPTVMASSSTSSTGSLRQLGGGADAVVVEVADSTVLFFGSSTFMLFQQSNDVRESPRFLIVPQD
jgi:hypothetical protein